MRRIAALCVAVTIALAAVTVVVRTSWSPACIGIDEWDPRWLWFHCWDPPECDDCKYGS
jgi:hypothetical protein